MAYSLKQPPNEEEKKSYIEYCMELHAKGIKYDKKQLVSFILGVKNQENLAELFCSELVAAALRSVGRLPKDTNPSAMTPSDVVHSKAFHGRGPNIKLNTLRYQIERPKLLG